MSIDAIPDHDVRRELIDHLGESVVWVRTGPVREIVDVSLRWARSRYCCERLQGCYTIETHARIGELFADRPGQGSGALIVDNERDLMAALDESVSESTLTPRGPAVDDRRYEEHTGHRWRPMT